MLVCKKRGFKNKRGSLAEPMFWLIDLLLIILVIYLTTDFINNITEKTTFERNFLARDIALFTGAVYTSPANLWFDYPSTTLWFSFGFEDNIVNVFEGKEIPDRLKATYPYIGDKNLALKKIIAPIADVSEKKPFIEKIFFIRNFHTYKPKLEQGVSVSLRFTKLGEYVNVGEQSEIFPDIKTLKCSQIGKKSEFPKEVATIWTQKEDLKEALEEVKKGLYQVVIIIKYGENSDETINNIKAYIPISQQKFEESRHIGCLILNELIANNDISSLIKEKELTDITGLSVVPIDIGLNQESRHIIVLEIGNLQIDKSKNILNHEKTLNDAIEKSIENALAK